MDRATRTLSRQLQSLNQHLAKSRRSLDNLLEEDKPVVQLRDKSEHYFKPGELQKIAGLLTPGERQLFRLPIYIELSSDKYGKGTARITGKIEGKVVAAVLGREPSGDELFLYRPELRVLRRELPTTTQYMFTVSIH
ncbi:MAG: DUF61 family protein [Candidatus Hydrothermarchaeota archaeon]|jgi:hypothetical protein|nr:DUF61 family protein [Candidatus Hydrothermarchaeota archaeon]